MPFKSKEQERYLQINEPEIYRDWVEKYGRFKGAESFGAEGGYSHQVFNTTSKAHAEKVASLVPDSIVIVNLHGIPDDSSHYFVMSKTSYDEARPYFMGWLRENDYFRTNQFLSEVKYDAESFNAENEKRSKYMNEKRSKYMDYIYDMFYTPDSDAYKLREIRYPKLKGQEHQIASQVRNAFDKRQSPFDSVLHNNLKGLSMTRQPFYYHIPYKGKLFVFSYIVKGRGRLKQGYHTYYPPDSQFGEEQICGLETKHGDECYCYGKRITNQNPSVLKVIMNLLLIH